MITGKCEAERERERERERKETNKYTTLETFRLVNTPDVMKDHINMTQINNIIHIF
jgi:hypothetical protein